MATELVDWSRAQFALTALYHFLFVPLTLGLSFIVAIMESIYVKTRDERWKTITRFWMTLFAINFAIGVATGLIMEFEFGTNWSNYSWFVGDIFGAPLAIEGILAFFMESTFFAVMFFGWNKVSKGFHLLSTWLVAVGSNLSAFWILVANGWMQYPVGMSFNPDTVRHEMVSFLDVALSPVAVAKFLHTIGSGYVIGALFVVGISAWMLLRGRDLIEAKRSMAVGASFGLVVSLFLALSGDESAYQVAQHQPVKLAAMEGFYKGKSGAEIVAVGILNPDKQLGDTAHAMEFELSMPYALSLLGYHDADAFVPGLEDLVYGNEAQGIEGAASKIEKGKEAVSALEAFKAAKKSGDAAAMEEARARLEPVMGYFGYGFLESPEAIVPPVAITFYSFHVMVALGFYFIVLFALLLWRLPQIERYQTLLKAALFSIPLGYIAAEAGWIVAEVGRQPWAIQDLMPVGIAATQIDAGNVMVSFWLFAVLFTVLLIAEIKIMLRQIALGIYGGH
ncbi:MAG: cytochrome ubiquinol oxidase subunit I [Campylobacterales bacterium]|nr:cytochrome ubiquinol oxidase subunit I [Campylobacterales bacterium]